MANKLRAANRKKAEKLAGVRSTGDGSGGRASRSSGSPRHHETVGPGPMAGAGELNTPHAGPGIASKGYAGRDRSETPNAATPSGKPPKGMRTEYEGE